MPDSAQTAVSACTSEIRVNLVVFFLPVFIIAGLIFPAFTLYWTAYALIAVGEQTGLLHVSVRELLLANLGHFVLLVVPPLFTMYGWHLYRRLASTRVLSNDSRKTKALPDTDKARALSDAVANLWNVVGNSGKPAPQVVWFINFNALARAVELTGLSQIQVSSGLWDRFVKKDSLGTIILAHEIAHLVHRDLPVFATLDATVSAIRKLVRWISYAAVFAAICAAGYELRTDITSHQNMRVILIHLAGVPVVTTFVIFPLWLGDWVIRRYGGFITSLMELRADVTAAEWTENFTQALGQDATVHKSSLRELGQSLVSLNLTHMSETERLNILDSADRLTTPKTRYYALSIVLALALPLNSFTPLLWNGALDHFFIAGVVVALHIVTFLMMALAARHHVISWKRALMLATGLFVATGLATINLYQLGYYLTVVGASFLAPNSFADKLLYWPDLRHAAGVSLRGMAGEFLDIYWRWDTLPAIGVSALLVRFLSQLASGIHLGHLYKAVGLVMTGYAAVIACYDPQRNFWYDNLVLSPAGILDGFPTAHGGRLVLPVIIMAALLACFRLLTSATRLLQKNSASR